MKTPLDLLTAADACSEGLAWARSLSAQTPDLTPQLLWDRCERSDWMLWWLRTQPTAPDARLLTLFSCDCAGRVLHLYEARYPGDLPEATSADARTAFADARAIIDTARGDIAGG